MKKIVMFVLGMMLAVAASPAGRVSKRKGS